MENESGLLNVLARLLDRDTEGLTWAYDEVAEAWHIHGENWESGVGFFDLASTLPLEALAQAVKQARRKKEMEKAEPMGHCVDCGWKGDWAQCFTDPTQSGAVCPECRAAAYPLNYGVPMTNVQSKPPFTGIVHRLHGNGLRYCRDSCTVSFGRDPEDMTPVDENSEQWKNTNCPKCWEKAPDWAIKQFPQARLAALGEPNKVVGHVLPPMPLPPPPSPPGKVCTKPWVMKAPPTFEADCGKCRATIGYHLGMVELRGSRKSIGTLRCPVCEGHIAVTVEPREET